jgi:RimJ/RimL family protein N-acetyltransferase
MKEDFKYIRENFLLLPYAVGVIDFKEDVLVDIYNKLRDEDLYSVVFHDNPKQTLNQFISFFSSPLVALSFFVYLDNGIEVPAGMCWLTDIVSSDNVIKKAQGSFVFFKEFQSPRYTTPFREIGLDFWFNRLNVDIVTGLTPSDNRPALIFNKRAGFKEIGRIPNFTLLFGKPCHGVVTYLDKVTFNRSQESPYGIGE